MKPIPILSNEESKSVERCLTCNKPLKKEHFRTMYCDRACRNKAHLSRKSAKAAHARMTPALYRKLEELREASEQQRT